MKTVDSTNNYLKTLELAQDLIDEFLGLLEDLDVKKVLGEYEEWVG